MPPQSKSKPPQKKKLQSRGQYHKTTNAVFEQRVRELLQISTIASRSEIIRYTEKQGWGLSARQVDNYIAECKKILSQEFENFKLCAAESIYANRLHIYKKALQRDDLKICRDILLDFAKMTGVDTANVDLTSNGEQIAGFVVKIDDIVVK